MLHEFQSWISFDPTDPEVDSVFLMQTIEKNEKNLIPGSKQTHDLAHMGRSL